MPKQILRLILIIMVVLLLASLSVMPILAAGNPPPPPNPPGVTVNQQLDLGSANLKAPIMLSEQQSEKLLKQLNGNSSSFAP
jgi:hypothetical protein